MKLNKFGKRKTETDRHVERLAEQNGSAGRLARSVRTEEENIRGQGGTEQLDHS